MSRTKGNPNLAFAFEGTGQKPLDARLIVDSHADLMNSYQDAQNGNNVYDGMPVVVIHGDNNKPELWVLKDKAAYLAVAGIGKTPDTTAYATYWQRMDAGGVDLTELATTQTTANAAKALAESNQTEIGTDTTAGTIKGRLKAIEDTTPASDSQLTALSTKVDGMETTLDNLSEKNYGFYDYHTLTHETEPTTLTAALEGLLNAEVPFATEGEWDDEGNYPRIPVVIGFKDSSNGGNYTLYAGYGVALTSEDGGGNWRRLMTYDDVVAVYSSMTKVQFEALSQSNKTKYSRKVMMFSDDNNCYQVGNNGNLDLILKQSDVTANYYTKVEADGQLALKLDIDDAADTYATKTQLDAVQRTAATAATAIGDETSGLTKDVNDLKTTVATKADASALNSYLQIADVDETLEGKWTKLADFIDLSQIVGDSTSGLVKMVDSHSAALFLKADASTVTALTDTVNTNTGNITSNTAAIEALQQAAASADTYVAITDTEIDAAWTAAANA